MEYKHVLTSSLIPYERNPRRNDQAVDAVAASIREFGFKVPIVIDRDNVVVAGHTRLKAALKLGLETVPVIVADDLTPEQIKAFRLADNKTAELAEWDLDMLDLELGDIEMDMEPFGFDLGGEEPEPVEEPEEDNTYISKTDIPQYEPSGEDVSLSDCLDKEKYETLMLHIKQSGVTDDEKFFLCMAAARHLCFSYKKIADYYASKASAEMQDLMEESALVLIDYGDAIKNGYTRLSKRVGEVAGSDA